MNIIALAYALIASGIGWAAVLASGDVLVRKDERIILLCVWFVLTIGLFVIPMGTVFLLLVAVVLLAVSGSRHDPLAVAFTALVATPTTGLILRGIPGINYLLEFTVALVASMVIFLPAAIKAPAARPRRPMAGVDRAVFALFMTLCVLKFRDTTFTDGIRASVQLSFRILIPYLAFSRAITTPERLRTVVRIAVAGMTVAGCIGFILAVVGWQVYDVAEARLFDTRVAGTATRIGLRRSAGPQASEPISFGVTMLVGFAMALGLFAAQRTGLKRWIPIGGLLAGVLGTVARGPMLGVGIAVMAFAASRPKPTVAMARTVAGFVVIGIPLILFTSFGRNLLTLIPGLSGGATVGGDFDYRERLFEVGIRVALKNPFFGRPDFRDDPDMEELVQGQGIIDIVNTYLAYALEYGFVTLFLFAAALGLAGLGLFGQLRRLPAEDPSGLRAVASGLFAGLTAFCIVIGTTSSVVGLLPIFTWILLGLCVACGRVIAADIAGGLRPIAAEASGLETLPAVQEPARPQADGPKASRPEIADGPAGDEARPSIGLQSPPTRDLPPGPRW